MSCQTTDLAWFLPVQDAVVGFGMTDAEMTAEYEDDPSAKRMLPSKKALFSAATDLRLEITYLHHQVGLARYAARPNWIARWLAWQCRIDTIDYDLNIADYASWREDQRLNLEYFLQSCLRADGLTVNGRAVAIGRARRIVDTVVRGALETGIPVAVIAGGLIAFMSSSGALRLAALFASILAAAIVARLGTLAAVFLLRDFLPRSYLRFMMTGDSAEKSGGTLSRLLSGNSK